jgi:hypothetical protein
MVGPRWRGTALGIRLCQAVIRHYVASGLEWDYIVVRPQMESFFMRLGYQRTAPDVDFPGVGSLAPLRLNLDPAYLRSTRSAFSGIASEDIELVSSCRAGGRRRPAGGSDNGLFRQP